AHHEMTRGDWVRFASVIIFFIGCLYLVWPFWPLKDVVNLGLDLQGGVRLVLEGEGVSEMDAASQTETIDRIITILANRIDQYGLANAELRRFGGDRILVSIPGATDPQEARRLIGQTAMLEFRQVVRSGVSPLDDLVPESMDEELLRDLNGIPYILKSDVLLTGAALADAKVQVSQAITTAGRLMIQLSFNQEGAEQFAKVLRDLGTGERLAIILDSTVYSAPVIEESIVQAARSEGWRGVKDSTTISGKFTQEEAKRLAVVLRAGALPVAIQVDEETTVGPTLGNDSISRGMMTIVIGFGLILIYMLFYYRVLGIVADVALLLNLLILFGALVLFRAVLTLPGIAGIILTIGTSVDANVIIFERIKEERRAGKSPLAAVRSGYERSMSALIDSNVANMAIAVILLAVGTGPVRGFAVTLAIGIAASLYCALIASRLLIEKAGFWKFIPATAEGGNAQR
ncbi:MAG: protein translocase subunit SecD, partial [Candidatus Bipolaricaulis sp.]|nr:protein translocase subunit SecD [Candidatus Bipolaricaulis sp.]